MKKLLALFVCTIMIFLGFELPVYALDVETSSRAINVSATHTDLYIDGSGNATISVGYYGYDGITTNGTITTKLQKRFLLIFWQDVDGGSWTDYGNGVNYSTSHSISVKPGYYRVQAEYVIYGNGGAPDTIAEQVEAEY